MKQNEVYFELFNDWDDIKKEYEMNDEKPEEVLFAYYSYESYSGDSFVLYRNADKYYINEGSHCSCYGLEGQWTPEEYDKETLIKTLSTRKFYEKFIQEKVNEIIKKLSKKETSHETN